MYLYTVHFIRAFAISIHTVLYEINSSTYHMCLRSTFYLLRIFVYNMESEFPANSLKSVCWYFFMMMICSLFLNAKYLQSFSRMDRQAEQPFRVVYTFIPFFLCFFLSISCGCYFVSKFILFILRMEVASAAATIICNTNQSFDFISIFPLIWVTFNSLDWLLQYFHTVFCCWFVVGRRSMVAVIALLPLPLLSNGKLKSSIS